MIRFACHVLRRDGVSVRLEVTAADRVSAARAALAQHRGVSASSTPIVTNAQAGLDALGFRRSPFPFLSHAQ